MFHSITRRGTLAVTSRYNDTMDTSSDFNQEFDFIVVGAGSAGCVLANRLSENGQHTVLLLEAGGRDSNPVLRIPLVAGLAYHWKSSNWGYSTCPQTALNDRSIVWPRGKVLGGSSTINGMMYMRGNREDYDRWSRNGLDGWSYQDVLPYFKRSEHNPERAGDSFHGTVGPLHVQRARGENPLYQSFLDSGYAEGFKENRDFNGQEQEGLGLYDFNIRNGRRESAATAFLHPFHDRQNLEVWTQALASRVIIKEGRAEGIELEHGGESRRVRARRETILCGGAINTPQLLMLSGIGAGDELQKHGIEVVADSAQVGSNLHDHLGVYLTYGCKDPITLYSLFRADRALLAFARAMITGRGPATSIPLEAGGFLKTRPDLDIPDIHITFVPGLNLETTRSGQGKHGYLINFYQLRPESRGSVSLASSDINEAPVIDPNYLTAEADKQCLRDGVRLARKIGENPALARHKAHDISPVAADLANDETIDSWVRSGANTIFHPVGSCRMGADENSVVDARLRVRGVDNLRVADASVMPSIIGGNTSAPCMMIAEKAADLILDN